MAVKFFSTEYESGSGGGKVEVKQVTKLNIKATVENPHVTTIEREFDNKFDRLPIEVLKATLAQNVIEVLAEFDNSDKKDFEENSFVEFDGVMKLKTEYIFETEELDEGIYGFDLSELSVFGDDFVLEVI